MARARAALLVVVNAGILWESIHVVFFGMQLHREYFFSPLSFDETNRKKKSIESMDRIMEKRPEGTDGAENESSRFVCRCECELANEGNDWQQCQATSAHGAEMVVTEHI